MVSRSTHADARPLLTRIIDESLDQDYRHAAEARLRSTVETAPSTGVRSAKGSVAIVLIALTAFGGLLGTAGAESFRSAGETQGTRTVLINQIVDRRERIRDQQQRVRNLREGNRLLRSDLSASEQGIASAATTSKRLTLVTGAGTARGPGIRIVVAAASDATNDRFVRADDLAILIDALWNAGAEAIAIDDQRLTALSALRNSGLSIGVNRVSLKAPFTVRAIGDPARFEADLLSSTSGVIWQRLVTDVGFEYEATPVEAMDLPSAGQPRFRYVGASGAGAADSDARGQENAS
ncbi:MAG: DUF881 domain-containing protein [Nocardioides sp.]